ncbi:MAG: hypothetical protein H6744_02740 [Deltaproteobacteria bacterium]|nr:hypothetical protein [Deltaproteobacteria bacterium]
MRKPDGTVLRFPNLDVLQSWIRDGIVVKGDWIEHEEAGWTRVEAVTELAVMMAKSTPAPKPQGGPRLATEPVDDDPDEALDALVAEDDGPPPLPFPNSTPPTPEPMRTRKGTRPRPSAMLGAPGEVGNVIPLPEPERPGLSREELESESESVLGAVVPPALPSDAGSEALLPLTPGTRPRGAGPRTGPLSTRGQRREPSRADIELQRALIRRGRAAKLRRRALLGVAFVGGLAGLTVWALSQRDEATVPRLDEPAAAEGTSETQPGAEAGQPSAEATEAKVPLATAPSAKPAAPASASAATAGAAGPVVSAEALAAAKAQAADRAAEQARALAAAKAEAAQRTEAGEAGAAAARQAAERQAEAAEAARQAAEVEAAKKAADAEAARQAAAAEAAQRAEAAKKAAEAEAAKKAAEAEAAKKAAEAEAAKKAAEAEAAKKAADAAAARKAADAEAAKKAADAAAAKKAADAAAAKKAADAAAAKKAAAAKPAPTSKPAPKTESRPAGNDVASLMAAAKKKEKGQPVEALRLYREALALSPANTDVLMAMGRTQIALANIAGAEAYLRKCRAISASHSGCLYWLARTLAMSGKSAESKQLFHEYLSRNPDGSLADDVRKRLGE